MIQNSFIRSEVASRTAQFLLQHRFPVSRSAAVKCIHSIKEQSDSKTALQLFDADCNFTHPDLQGQTEILLRNAALAGVTHYIVPGSTIEDSQKAIALCNEFPHQNLFATCGVHPYCCVTQEATYSIQEAMQIIESHRGNIVAVGECGLDYSEGFPSREAQKQWFRPQVEIACQLGKPLFIHERLAHSDLLSIMNSFMGRLPPTIIHCFTGTEDELKTYMKLGFYVSFSGVICRKDAGASLRNAIKGAQVPLERILIETDAPYLGFPGGNPSLKKGKTYPNVPESLPKILEQLSQTLNITSKDLAKITFENALKFFDVK